MDPLEFFCLVHEEALKKQFPKAPAFPGGGKKAVQIILSTPDGDVWRDPHGQMYTVAVECEQVSILDKRVRVLSILNGRKAYENWLDLHASHWRR